MQEQFNTILSELTKICKDMQQYNDLDEYKEYGDIDWPFLPTIWRMMNPHTTWITALWSSQWLPHGGHQWPKMMELNQGRGWYQWNSSTWLANTDPPNPQLYTLLDNIAVTNTNTGNITPVIPNPFYDLFRDTLQSPKPPNTLWVALQNFGGWPQWASHKKQ